MIRKFCLLSLCLFSLCRLYAQDTLYYTSPDSIRIDSVTLYDEIGFLMYQAIDAGALPGAQILLAKDGAIFFNESYGFHTYDSLRPVRESDLYDLASITKVAATTLALMKLYDDGLLNLDLTLGHYFPFLSKSDKADITIREALAHNGRLKSWIPFYKECLRSNGRYRRHTFSNVSKRSYPWRIPGSGIYMHKHFYEKKLLKMIRMSPLNETEEYVYSGLSFYLFPELVKRLTDQTFEDYLTNNFYMPLGVSSIGFNPKLRGYKPDQIVPTEVDNFFRMDTLHGDVHDEGAAMMLGISGNAGLFGNAHDLAVIFQMLLNGGTYKGQRYLREETIREFTRCQYCQERNRRGIGFDKPLIEYDPVKSSVARLASPASFGHTGFTGTLVWADPENGFLFIFLSNRVYPTRDNKLIYQLNIRPNIHDLVYELLMKDK